MTLADSVALSPDPEAVDLVAQKPARLLKQAWRLWRTKIGVLLAGGVLLIALLGPYIAPHGPADFVGAPNASSPGIFGTDHLGQDVWSRFLYGGRSILWIASAATALGLITGALVGLVAAYSRGTLDDVLMRGMDGPATLAALRQIDPAVRCCFMTVGTTGEDEEADRLLGLGVEAVLPKPYRLEAIRGVISRV